MGTDKAFVLVEGRTLLARMLGVAQSVSAAVAIVGDPGKYAAFAPVVEDVFPGCGPLAGIHAALCSSKTELNVILAVDIPFVSPPLVSYVVSRASKAKAIVTVPRVARGLQPLCAVYRREFADSAEEALRAGRYKIDALFDQTRTQIIREEELESAGFSTSHFRNLNTPGEVNAANE